jgi:hypothetical protein
MAVLPVGIGPVTGYNIERSLRFNSADSAYLNRTFGTPTDNKKWTFSCWIKRSKLSSTSTGAGATSLFCTLGAGAQGFFGYGWTDDNDLVFGYGGFARVRTNNIFRDLSAWYHVVLVFDSANATAANRALIYINGVAASLVTINAVGLNDTTLLNSAVNTGIGKQTGQPIVSMDMYLTETYFIDGQALTPSDFGETDAATGVWKPKSYTGTYGTNGFELNFSDNSNTTAATLGKDSSGNSNNWTPNNFSVTAGAGNDSMVDSPTSYGSDTGVGGEVRGNYCTWNRLQTSSSITLNNGNLDATISGGFLIYSAAGTVEVTTGKWYYETVVTAGFSTNYPLIGVCDVTQITSAINTSFYSTAGGGNSTGIIARGKTNVYLSNNTSTSDGVTYNYTSDVIMIAFDATLGKVWFGKNGTWNNSSDPATNTGGHTFSTVSGNGYRPYVQCNADTSNSWTSNFGQRAFAYTAPSGFKALCTTNLPTPTIGATSTTQANDYFDATLYTGTSASQLITNSGSFQPDFVWTKLRNAGQSHSLYDAIRGVNNILQTDTTSAETTVANSMTAFNSNGFTVGSAGNSNLSPYTYVGWQWNAGGSNATNTSGTITSTVRANTTSGFSIVTYTGTGANATVGHGLGVAPSMVIVRNRVDAGSIWPVWHNALAGTEYLQLQGTDAKIALASMWNSTVPTSTVFSVGTVGQAANANTKTYVAYCFAAVAGYSAFGSYTGNGSTDGPFIYLGFRPEFVMIKNATSAGSSWEMFDNARETFNLMDLELLANSSNAEGTYTYGDFVSNGFKLRSTNNGVNQSSATLIYMAFAENPFKYSLAR